MTARSNPRSPAPEPDAEATLRVTVRPNAAGPLETALAARGTDSVVRLFVEPGVHPRVGMLVDRASPADLRTRSGRIDIVVDPTGLKFLQDATVDYVSEGGSAGFRVTGPNIPATEPAADVAASVPPPTDRTGREAAIRSGLKKVFDPEIPMNILDLGLIYGIDWPAEDRVAIRMTMTSPGCPVADLLVEEVRRVALAVPGVLTADVEVVWDPPWGPDRMSEFARRQFGYA